MAACRLLTTGTLYSGPITVGVTATIKAIAYAPGFTDRSLAPVAPIRNGASDVNVFYLLLDSSAAINFVNGFLG